MATKRKTKFNGDYVKVAAPIIKKYAGKVGPRDIAFLINQKLPKENHIAPTTFEKMVYSGDVENENVLELVDLYYVAYIDRKITLVDKLQRGSKAWQRYAWLLERVDPKLYHLNFKHEHTGADGASLFENKTNKELEELISKFKTALDIVN